MERTQALAIVHAKAILEQVEKKKPLLHVTISDRSYYAAASGALQAMLEIIIKSIEAEYETKPEEALLIHTDGPYVVFQYADCITNFGHMLEARNNRLCVGIYHVQDRAGLDWVLEVWDAPNPARIL